MYREKHINLQTMSLRTRPVYNGLTLQSTATDDCLGAILVVSSIVSLPLLQSNLTTSRTKSISFASQTPTTPTTLNRLSQTATSLYILATSLYPERNMSSTTFYPGFNLNHILTNSLLEAITIPRLSCCGS